MDSKVHLKKVKICEIKTIISSTKTTTNQQDYLSLLKHCLVSKQTGSNNKRRSISNS